MDYSLRCYTPLLWADMWNFFPEILELTQKISEFMHSWADGRHLASNQAASSNVCIIDRRWRTIISMLISISINRVHNIMSLLS